MNADNIRKLMRTEFPSRLTEIADPPTQLYVSGTMPDENTFVYLAVVGSREYTPYGRQSCERLIRGLAGYPVAIVSGLALGIDSIAHQTALEVGLPTVAIPGSGLDERVLYPACHKKLARDIVHRGGALISEFDPLWKPRKESFPQRNRIMAGISHALLVIEATMRSGTLITARLASEYNRDVFAVPGPITSVTSAGPHMLIKNGAALVASSDDIVTELNLKRSEVSTGITTLLSPLETHARNVLAKPHSRDETIRALNIPISEANALLASLEIKGYIRERMGLIEWML